MFLSDEEVSSDSESSAAVLQRATAAASSRRSVTDDSDSEESDDSDVVPRSPKFNTVDAIESDRNDALTSKAPCNSTLQAGLRHSSSDDASDSSSAVSPQPMAVYTEPVTARRSITSRSSSEVEDSVAVVLTDTPGNGGGVTSRRSLTTYESSSEAEDSVAAVLADAPGNGGVTSRRSIVTSESSSEEADSVAAVLNEATRDVGMPVRAKSPDTEDSAQISKANSTAVPSRSLEPVRPSRTGSKCSSDAGLRDQEGVARVETRQVSAEGKVSQQSGEENEEVSAANASIGNSHDVPPESEWEELFSQREVEEEQVGDTDSEGKPSRLDASPEGEAVSDTQTRRRAEREELETREARLAEEHRQRQEADLSARKEAFWALLTPEEARRMRCMLESLSLYQQRKRQNDQNVEDILDRISHNGARLSSERERLQAEAEDARHTLKKETVRGIDLWVEQRRQGKEEEGLNVPFVSQDTPVLPVKLGPHRGAPKKLDSGQSQRARPGRQATHGAQSQSHRLDALKAQCERAVAARRAEDPLECSLREQQHAEVAQLELVYQTRLEDLRSHHAKEAASLRLCAGTRDSQDTHVFPRTLSVPQDLRTRVAASTLNSIFERP